MLRLRACNAASGSGTHFKSVPSPVTDHTRCVPPRLRATALCVALSLRAPTAGPPRAVSASAAGSGWIGLGGGAAVCGLLGSGRRPETRSALSCALGDPQEARDPREGGADDSLALRRPLPVSPPWPCQSSLVHPNASPVVGQVPYPAGRGRYGRGGEERSRPRWVLGAAKTRVSPGAGVWPEGAQRL